MQFFFLESRRIDRFFGVTLVCAKIFLVPLEMERERGVLLKQPQFFPGSKFDTEKFQKKQRLCCFTVPG